MLQLHRGDNMADSEFEFHLIETEASIEASMRATKTGLGDMKHTFDDVLRQRNASQKRNGELEAQLDAEKTRVTALEKENEELKAALAASERSSATSEQSGATMPPPPLDLAERSASVTQTDRKAGEPVSVGDLHEQTQQMQQMQQQQHTEQSVCDSAIFTSPRAPAPAARTSAASTGARWRARHQRRSAKGASPTWSRRARASRTSSTGRLTCPCRR